MLEKLFFTSAFKWNFFNLVNKVGVPFPALGKNKNLVTRFQLPQVIKHAVLLEYPPVVIMSCKHDIAALSRQSRAFKVSD